jgi:hypothetical protein
MRQSAVGPLPTFRTEGTPRHFGFRPCGGSRRNRKCRGMLPHHCLRPRAAVCAARTAAGEGYSDSNGA